MPAKNEFFNTIFFAYYFLKLHLHHFSKIKSQKESLNSRNQGFFLLFLHDDRRIRIRIREAQKHVDPVDRDLQHSPNRCLAILAGGKRRKDIIYIVKVASGRPVATGLSGASQLRSTIPTTGGFILFCLYLHNRHHSNHT